MSSRTVPYPDFTFVVYVSDPSGALQELGGFQEITGLQVSSTPVDISMKRGVVTSALLTGWINAARSGGANSTRNVVVTQRSASGSAQVSWSLSSATLSSCNPPTPASHSTDMAVQKLVVSASVKFIPPVWLPSQILNASRVLNLYRP